ncbi:MAG: hypothetical protein B6U85_02960 [Desulfurococcales archaeon ex4484_42]|nr:MAG: hypothetical protein B6U85_02960 [Desulfurococcales archaeon ex4484_42]
MNAVLKLTLTNVRMLIAESRMILNEALKMLSRKDLELAEALATKALERLNEASTMLSQIEQKVLKGE